MISKSKIKRIQIMMQDSGLNPKFIMTGMRIGKLVVTKDFKRQEKTGRLIWKCKCDCGNTNWVVATSLRKKNPVKSCGCSKSKYSKEESAFRRKAQAAKSNARERNLEWNLTIDEAIKLVKSPCHYCGTEPKRPFNCKWIRQKKPYQVTVYVNGIDRVDNTRGYTFNNVTSCCTTCNSAKSTMTYPEFNVWRNQVAQHLKRERSKLPKNKNLKVLFDVDKTLIDENDKFIYDTINLLLSFVDLGAQVYVASGGGVDYATMWVRRLSLEDKVKVIPKESASNMNIDLTFDDQKVNLGKVNIEV